MSMFYELMMKKKGIPSRYQEVEYIESTGTQWIDTGIVPSATIQFVCDVEFTDILVGRVGTIKSIPGKNYANRHYFGVLSSRFIGANGNIYNHSITNANTNRHIFSLDNKGLSIDNVLVYSHTGEYETNLSFYLFACNDNGSANYYSKVKIYNSQIYDNNRLVRNFIPVYDTLTNKYGIWESVQGKFCGNAGTGDFIGA